MEIRDRAFLKEWFKKGKYPKQEHFWDWLESFWHKEEDSIPVDNIEGLSDTLNNKYEKSAGETLEDRMDEAEKRLGNYDGSIKDTGDILNEHTETLLEHGARLDDHKERLEKYGEQLDEHTNRLDTTEQSLKDFSVTGAGNAITTIEHAEDELTLIATKGNTFVDIASSQTITGAKTFSADLRTKNVIYGGGSIYSNGKTGVRDGKAGGAINSEGYLYLTSSNNAGIVLLSNNATNINTSSLVAIPDRGLVVGSAISPTINNNYNLGGGNYRWLNTFTSQLWTGLKQSVGDTNVGTVITSDGYLYNSGGIFQGIGKISVNDGVTGVGINAGSVYLTGSSSAAPQIAFYRANATANTGYIINNGNFQLATNTNFLPAANNNYNLGAK